MIDITNLGTSIFATGIGAALITQCKGFFQSIGQYLRFGYTISTTSEMNPFAYKTLVQFISNYKSNVHKTKSYLYINDTTKDCFSFGFGNFCIISNIGQLMIVNHSQEKREAGPYVQTLRIKIIGYKAKQQYQKINEKIEKTLKIEDIKLFTIGDYSSPLYIQKRNMDTIFHPKKEELVKFLDNFIHSKDIYKKNQITYKTGILLYGPPGTGKTSFIKAIATYLNYNILMLNENGYINYHAIYPNSIIVIEDIDKILENNTKEKEEDITITSSDISLKNNTLHKLMQILDGLTSINDIIFIATTNHIEKLPPELIRDGRFDLKLELNNINKDYAQQMCESFGIHINDIEDQISEYPVNPAYLQNIILKKIRT